MIKYNIKESKYIYVIKLSNYNCSKGLNTYLGNLVYMPLETLEGNKYNYNCDLWGIGIIIYQFIMVNFHMKDKLN